MLQLGETSCTIFTLSLVSHEIVMANKNVSEWNLQKCVGRPAFDTFPIKNGLKQGDALLQLPINYASQYSIRRVQVNQEGLKLNGTH